MMRRSQLRGDPQHRDMDAYCIGYDGYRECYITEPTVDSAIVVNSGNENKGEATLLVMFLLIEL
jgi:hypothetical protein